MALATDATTILQLFKTGWADRTPVAWPNVNFTPPQEEGIRLPWVKLDILWGDAFVSTMKDTGRNTIVGAVVVSIFVPKGTARGDLMAKADTVRGIFNRVISSGVRFGAASAPIAQSDDEWEQATVRVSFSVEEVT